MSAVTTGVMIFVTVRQVRISVQVVSENPKAKAAMKDAIGLIIMVERFILGSEFLVVIAAASALTLPHRGFFLFSEDSVTRWHPPALS